MRPAPASVPRVTRSAMWVRRPRWQPAARRVCGALGGQRGVAAGDQPLAGVVGVADLGQVMLVEQAHLQRPILGGQFGDGRGARAVIHPKPAPASLSSPRASMRAEVIMPRSPTNTSRSSPKLARMTSTMSVNAVGSAVSPENTRTATGHPAGSVRMPYSICASPFCDHGSTRGGHLTMPAGHPRAGQVKQRHPRRIRLRPKVFGGELLFDRVLPLHQPVHRRIHLVGGCAGNLQVGSRVQSPHRDSVDSFDAGKITREIINPSARSRTARRPSSPARPYRGHRRHRGHMPVRQRAHHRELLPRTKVCPLASPPARERRLGSIDRLATVSLRTLTVPVGAAQQHRLIDTLVTLLIYMSLPD